MPDLVGLVVKRKNVIAERGLQRSTLTLDRVTIDGAPFNGRINLASRPVTDREAYATLKAANDRAVVVIEATQGPEGEPWALDRIVATSRDEDPRLETIAATTSPARHPNDVVGDNEDHLVPDVFREEPISLPGIGLAWARYWRRGDLCFVPEGWFTDSLGQRVLPVDEFKVCVSDDSDLAGVSRCIRSFLDADSSLREQISPHVFAYYKDLEHQFGGQPGFPSIPTAAEVWDHVMFRSPVAIHDMLDGFHYLVLEAECSWEPEHGLQLVFADGARLCRVSPYDGHPVNSDPTVIFEPAFRPNAT